MFQALAADNSILLFKHSKAPEELSYLTALWSDVHDLWLNG